MGREMRQELWKYKDIESEREKNERKRASYLPCSQNVPSQPGLHPLSQTPFVLLQPVHVTLHCCSQRCP